MKTEAVPDVTPCAIRGNPPAATDENQQASTLRQRLCCAHLLVTMLACLTTAPALADETGRRGLNCASEPDNTLRLECYDKAFRAATGASVPADSPKAVVPVGEDAGDPVPSVMSKFWELGPQDKRGTFVLRSHLPNFLLPIHYSSNINRAPSSPTQARATNKPGYRPIEAKMQISLRAKMAEDILLPGADLWFAYTQRSLWQVWDQDDSAPFRSTDYQPEAIYVIPVPQRLGELPFGWNLRMLQLGIAHQSNGQSDPYSRSWNRTYVGLGLERGNLALSLRANARLPEPSNDQNPDLVSYVGRGEVSLNWFPGKSTVSMTWRSNFTTLDRGSLQVDLTHPVFADSPTGLRWYAQFFSGYGETLLDYNHYQNRLGLGLSLFQF